MTQALRITTWLPWRNVSQVKNGTGTAYPEGVCEHDPPSKIYFPHALKSMAVLCHDLSKRVQASQGVSI